MTGAVFTGHINFWGTWFYWGYLVELFFILSGYFMYKYVDLISEGRFKLSEWIILRGKRLLPMVAISAVAYEIIIFTYLQITGNSWMGISTTIWGTVTTALGIQHGWSFSDPSVNYPTWYISVLILCYVLFYLLTVIAKKLKFSPMYLYAFMILWGCGIQTFSVSLPFFNTSTCRGFYGFFFGLLIAEFIKRFGHFKRIVISATTVICCLTVVFILVPSLVQNDLSYVLTFLMYPSIIILCETSLAKRIFSCKLWGVAGNISFDVYLWHNPMLPLMYVFIEAFGWSPDFSNLGYMYIFTLISIIVGVISYYALEKPLARFVDRQIAFFKTEKQTIK